MYSSIFESGQNQCFNEAAVSIKNQNKMVNSVDPDETAHKEAEKG